MAIRLAVVALAGVFTLGCQDGAATTPSPTGGLETAFAQARLEPNLKSLVVAREGATVRAEYFNGGGPDTPEYVWSVTKSVLALAVGAALDAGCLTSLDQTLGELLGLALVTDTAKARITLRHLLTMTSGIDFPEATYYGTGSSLYGTWIDAPDQVAFVLARAMTADPGTRFEYGSGTIHLASVALTRACGTSTAAFVGQHLFTPLQVPDRPWETDRQGYHNGGAGLSLAPRDMQAIGNMVLRGGRYEGRQVVSQEWITSMTRMQVPTAGPNAATGAYGYGWWVGQTTTGDSFHMANGWGGQFIIVVPAKRLTITTACRTTGLSGTAAMAQWQRIFQILQAQIIPAV